MSTDLKKYLALQTALVNERARIETRLADIARVLGHDGSPATSAPASSGGRRKFSEATKAKMRVAQRARWAKIKGKAGKASAPPKKQRKMSAAGRAAIAAAAKARWAKAKAAGKTKLGD